MDKKDCLNEFKKVLIACKKEQDHIWKQIGDWERKEYLSFSDQYGHPEDRYRTTIVEVEAKFKCQNCGLEKMLRKK